MTQNGVIETSSGRLRRAGFCDFENDGSFNATTESYRTDVPHPAKTEEDDEETTVTHWTGSVWDDVAK